MKKRHLVFIDGSGASAAGGTLAEFSNVFRLHLAFEWKSDDAVQVFSYFSGVGIRGDRLSAWTGRGLDELIREVYINISSNHCNGDELYLFGWSRGAAAARAVTSLIADVGLLGADRLNWLAELWQAHALQQLERRRAAGLNEEEANRLAEHLANLSGKFDSPPRIRFVGLFDTVAGNAWDRRHIFTDVNFDTTPLESLVDVGVQLLSADDRRLPSFAPLLWRGRSRADQKLEQIWMPGVHADVGGKAGQGYLSDLSLITMIDRVRTNCPELAFDDRVFRTELQDPFKHHSRVKVSDECSGPRRLLRRGKRAIGSIDAHSEMAHPLLGELHRRTISIRGRRSNYVNGAAHLPLAPEGDFAATFRDIDPFR